MEDLLSRIGREMHERLEELRGAVDERDRLQADLRALDAVPERFVGSPEPLCRGLVSPKVAWLMHTPRRPALERPGIARVSAGA